MSEHPFYSHTCMMSHFFNIFYANRQSNKAFFFQLYNMEILLFTWAIVSIQINVLLF